MKRFYVRNLLVCLALMLLILPGLQLKAADYYWVGGAGTWDQISHWASVSGGPANKSIIPSQNDDVFFDANSGLVAGTAVYLPLNSPAYCRNISWVGLTAVTSFLTQGQNFFVYGSVELGASVRYGLQAGGISFVGPASATFKMNGAGRYPSAGFFNPFYVDKAGGSLTLLDNIPAALNVGTILVVNGNLTMSGGNHTFGNFSSANNNTRSVDITNATLNMTGTWDYRGTNNTINTTGSYIIANIFNSDRFSFAKVDITSASGTTMVINNTTFDQLTFTNAASIANSVRIGANNTVNRLEYKGGGAIGTGNVINQLLLGPSNPGFLFTGMSTVNGPFQANTPDCNLVSRISGNDANSGITFGPGATVSASNVLLTNMKAAGSISLPVTVTGVDGGGNTGWNIQTSGKTVYWVGGAGDWNDKAHWSFTSGGTGGDCIPFVGDDVVFDANSGFTAASNTVTVSTTASCHNMTWTNVANAPILSNNSVLEVWGNSIVLDPSLSLNSGTIFLKGSKATTLTSNGCSKGNVTFRLEKTGTNGGLSLSDDLLLPSATISYSSGRLSMTGRNVKLNTFTSLSTAARTIDISNATVAVDAWDLDVTNLTSVNNASGSFIEANLLFRTNGFIYPKVYVAGTIVSITNATINDLLFSNTTRTAGTVIGLGGNNTIGTVEFKGGGEIRGNNAITNLLLAPGARYNFRNNQTINGLFRYNNLGCSDLGEMRGVGGIATLNFGPSSSLQFNYSLVQNMTATGAGVPITIVGVNAGGNTGFNITTSDSGPRYWVGGGGDWSDGSHWSNTSGGPSGACPPSKENDVFFDANSGFTPASNTVTSGPNTVWCHNMTWTNVANAPILHNGSNLEVWGSIVLDPSLTLNSGQIHLLGTEAATLTSNGCSKGNVIFRLQRGGVNGGLTLTDDLLLPSATIAYSSGRLIMPGRNLKLATFTSLSTAARTIDISNATIAVDAWDLDVTNFTSVNNASGSFIQAGIRFTTNGLTYAKVYIAGTAVSIFSATINDLLFSNTTPTAGTVIGLGGNNTIGTVEFKGGGEIRGNNTITNLLLAPGANYNIRNTQTINGLLRYNNGDCNGLGEMRGIAGTAPTLSFGPSSTLDFNNVLLQNMTATGKGVPITVTGTDAGGNTGFVFTSFSSSPRYWVGGSGDWNDPSHWASTSGGAGGTCVPTETNDVFFDANSFTSGSSTVTVNSAHAFCHNINWTGAAFSPTLNLVGGLSLNVSGSITLNAAVTVNATITMTGSENSTLTTNGNTLGFWIINYNKPGTTLKVTDDFVNPRSAINVTAGNLDMSGRTVTLGTVSDVNSGSATNFNINNANLILGAWQYTGANKTLQASDSQIKAGLFRSTAGTYNKVNITAIDNNYMMISSTTIDDLVFSNNSSGSQAWIGGGNTIRQMEFKGRGAISGSNTIGTLIFAPGMTYTFLAGTNNIISANWYASGTPCNPTQIASSGATPATITKTSGTVDLDYVRLSGITAAGITPFKAGEHSTDLGNNTNWVIEPYNGSATIVGLGPDKLLSSADFPYTIRTDGFFASPLAQFQWKNGSTILGTGSELVITAPGTYTVNVTYPDGCAISDQIVITKASSDLSVVNTVDKPTPAIGSQAVFTIVATNNGPQQTTGISVTDLLPTGYTYKSAAPSIGTYDVGTGIWNIGTLANGATSTLTITAVVKAAGPYTSTASITGPEADPVTGNNSSTVTPAPAPALLSITKNADAFEPGTDGSFIISFPSGVTMAEDITVTYNVTGSATPASDYMALQSTVLLAAGQNNVLVPVTVLNESLIEPLETVVLTLTSATSSNFTFGMSSTTATVNINDNDNIPDNRVITVTPLVANVTEPTGTRFVISLPTGITASEDITVRYEMAGTATNGADYQTMNGTATIVAGTNTVEVVENTLEDKIIEGSETVIMGLNAATTPTLGNFTFDSTSGRATLTIDDDDSTPANMVLSVQKTADATEPGINGAFTISLPEGYTAAADIQVAYSVGAGSTAASTADYQAISGAVTIRAGLNAVSLPVNVVDDNVIERDETVILNISGGYDGTNTYTANAGANSATVTIKDNDSGASSIVLLTKVSDAVENGTKGQYRVYLPPGVTSSEDVIVKFTTSGIAQNGPDYVLGGLTLGNIVIPAGANDVVIEVDALGDANVEGPEDIILNLTTAGSASHSFAIDPANNGAIVTIIDANASINTELEVVSAINGTESTANGSFIVKLAGSSTSAWDITVGYSLSGTAASGSDYQALGTIIIRAGFNSVTVPVSVIDDKVIEPLENLTFKIIRGSSTTGSTASYYPPSPMTGEITLTITDNDAAARVLKVERIADAAEPSTSGRFVVSLPTDYVPAADIVLTYTMAGSATRNTDYTVTTATLPAYTNSVTIPVHVIDDELMEPLETLTLNLAPSTDANTLNYTVAVGNGSATINLNDNDDLEANRVLSVAVPVDGIEDGTDGSIRINLPTGVLASELITVNFTLSGSATSGSDYTAPPLSATILFGQNGVTIPFTIINDQVIENSETVSITIIDGSSANFTYAPSTDNGSGTINVIDNDNTPTNRIVSVEMLQDGSEGSPNLRFRIFLPASISTSEPITLNYTLTGTAENITDYRFLEGALVIPAGDGGVAAVGLPVDDNIIEGTETVIFTLSGVTSNNFTFSVNPASSSALANILDNDDTIVNRPLSIFKTADAAEPGMNGAFNVSLPTDITASEDITINYTVSGNAVAGTDYRALSGNLLIPANQNNAEILVPVLNDFVYDDLETVTVTLTEGSSTNFRFPPHATNGSATLNIIDDEPVPPAITSFSPGSGYAGLKITITGLRFTGATAVAFNGTPASFKVLSPTSIEAIVGFGTSTGLITVTTPDGTATSVTNFVIDNVAPVAVAENVIAMINTPLPGNVLTNDSDPDGDAMTASLVTAPVNGTIVLNADGSFVYTPNANYYGSDSFTYQVCDNGTPSLCDTATVSITLNNLPGPRIADVSASNADRTYKIGDIINITTTFDQDVIVQTYGGAPRILLNTGLPGRYAEYLSGSGSNTLIFSYTVQAGDQSPDLDYQSTAIELNSATIQGVTNVDADLTLPASGGSGSLGINKNLVIDGIAPEIISVLIPPAGTYLAGQNMDFILNYSEAVTLDISAGTPRVAITLDNGGMVYALYLSGSGTTSHVYQFTVIAGQQDNTGIALATTLDPNGSLLYDVAGNPASETLNNVPSTATVLVDAVAPAVISINRADADPTSASSVIYTITFSESVTGVDLADFTLVSTASATGTLASLTPVNASTYTLTVNNVAGTGTLGADLKASGTGITDVAGNAIAGGFSGQLYTLISPAPTDISLSALVRAENQPAGTQIGLLSAASADGSYTYTLVTGAGSDDNASFSIAGNQLQTAQIFDFEAKSSYTVRIRATSSQNQSLEKAFIITVADVNEAPTLAAIANQDICHTSGLQTLTLDGISGGPESTQNTTLSISSTNSNMFDELSVGPVNNGNAVLSYRLKNDISGTADITVTATDNGGTSNGGVNSFSRSFALNVSAGLQVSIASSMPATVSKGASIELTASGASSYSWANASGTLSGQNSATLTVRPAQTTTYRVTGTSAASCISMQEITITVIEDYNLVASNVLTPNGDGKNDFFVVKNIDMYPNNEVRIFDRAGRSVYRKKNYNNEWDGIVNGSPLDEDTYYYIIDFGNGVKAKKGFISIVRKY